MLRNHLTWDITLRRESQWESGALPPAILTAGPRFHDTGMPDEIALLLPNNDGASALISEVASNRSDLGKRAIGLFLADPFFHAGREAGRLRDAGIEWIANLPTVEQQDHEFVQLLGDVGLDRSLEFERLGALQESGFNSIAVVAGREAAEAAARISPQAIIVIPRVVDFAAGFPSFRQRGAAARDVAEVLRAAGWHGPVLGLAAETEVGHETLWPDVLDGVVCRPKRLKTAGVEPQ
ncbi:hypothetical protein [Pelagibius sp. Alg239-R121]|uniref:hypothetical protein n=1 Tax=Pelagibius sp. Alg239-R121 TaxID=2993448 RepID=UPI0024A62455|nr:hypothetical protein [Pelagibius sp. Alg239-R121]